MPRHTLEHGGVSVSIFCGFISLCEDVHGPKFCGNGIEKLRQLLAEAERVYAELPDAPADPTPARSVSDVHEDHDPYEPPERPAR